MLSRQTGLPQFKSLFRGSPKMRISGNIPLEPFQGNPTKIPVFSQNLWKVGGYMASISCQGPALHHGDRFLDEIGEN